MNGYVLKETKSFMNVAIFLIIMLKKITGSVKWTKFKLKTHKRSLIRILLSKKNEKICIFKIIL